MILIEKNGFLRNFKTFLPKKSWNQNIHDDKKLYFFEMSKKENL